MKILIFFLLGTLAINLFEPRILDLLTIRNPYGTQSGPITCNGTVQAKLYQNSRSETFFESNILGNQEAIFLFASFCLRLFEFQDFWFQPISDLITRIELRLPRKWKRKRVLLLSFYFASLNENLGISLWLESCDAEFVLRGREFNWIEKWQFYKNFIFYFRRQDEDWRMQRACRLCHPVHCQPAPVRRYRNIDPLRRQ